MLDLRRLLVFHAVATRRSFSAAALAMSYTQSTVSESVAALERELGVTLLDRTSRPVGLAPAGEVVLGHVETLLGQAAAVEDDLAALTTGEAGRVRLAGFFTAWSTFLPQAIAAFSAAHPRVELELEQADPPQAMRLLRAGEVDRAVIFRFEPGDPADDAGAQLVTTRLAHDPYALAVPAAGPLARRRRLEVADLASARWCTAPLGSPATVIAAGLAVALLPALNLARPYPGVAVRDLPQAPPGRDVWCLRPAGRRLPAAQAMVAALKAAARDFAARARR
jgi:DNA-binding transcriptional LysR family regulator